MSNGVMRETCYSMNFFSFLVETYHLLGMKDVFDIIIRVDMLLRDVAVHTNLSFKQ
jgi:hypothetical protein